MEANALVLGLMTLLLHYNALVPSLNEELPERGTGVQEPVPSAVPFPCKIPRITEPATSVHRLRPGDIRVIAAIGDSMTAGTASLGRLSFLSSLAEDSGVSYAIGGAKTWREYFTLPNILKVFNPRLRGYTTRTIFITRKPKHLNMAKSAMILKDTLGVAKGLVNRIRRDKKIDFYNDWKLVTIFVGSVDVCAFACYEDHDMLRERRENLLKAFDYLEKNLPRTFINLMPSMEISVLQGSPTGMSRSCLLLRGVICRCAFSMKIEELSRIEKMIYKLDEDLAERYSNNDNFTIVSQPFLHGLNHIPAEIMSNETLYAPDCVHFSQKGHAMVALSLWANMLEPVGKKSTAEHHPSVPPRIKCPTKEAPFFFTVKNSKKFLETGRQ